jgi:hypothetical protein
LIPLPRGSFGTGASSGSRSATAQS